MSDPYQVLQTLLKKLRKDAHLSQQDLARLLGKPQSFVSKYETGERRLDIIELRQVCRLLNTDLVHFLSLFENNLNG